MLYFTADKPFASQTLEQFHFLQSMEPLVHSYSTGIQLLSKALIARLITADTMSDDTTLLMLVTDHEADHLVHLLTSVQSEYTALPIIPVLMDLSRLPQNLWAFASRETALILSSITMMNSISEDDQAKAKQMILKMKELTYGDIHNGEEASVMGTFQGQEFYKEGMM